MPIDRHKDNAFRRDDPVEMIIRKAKRGDSAVPAFVTQFVKGVVR